MYYRKRSTLSYERQNVYTMENNDTHTHNTQHTTHKEHRQQIYMNTQHWVGRKNYDNIMKNELIRQSLLDDYVF